MQTLVRIKENLFNRRKSPFWATKINKAIKKAKINHYFQTNSLVKKFHLKTSLKRKAASIKVCKIHKKKEINHHHLIAEICKEKWRKSHNQNLYKQNSLHSLDQNQISKNNFSLACFLFKKEDEINEVIIRKVLLGLEDRVQSIFP